MADAKATKPVELTADERLRVYMALELACASVLRASKAEKVPAIAVLRKQEYDVLISLLVKFS